MKRKYLLCYLLICLSLISASCTTPTGSDSKLAPDINNMGSEITKKSEENISNIVPIDIPIIMYHSIVDKNNNDYVISPKKVENDIKYLYDHGYKAVFVSDIIDYLNGKITFNFKPILLTADDGFYNNYTNLTPILKKYDAKCTVAIVGKFSENESALNAKQENIGSYLNYSQIKEMNDSGLYQIASHSYNMHNTRGRRGIKQLYGESFDKYKSVVVEDTSKLEKLLAENCGIKPNIYAYPFGLYNDNAKIILSEMGYKAIFTCYTKINKVKNEEDLLSLGRFNRASKYSTEYFFEKVVKLDVSQ